MNPNEQQFDSFLARHHIEITLPADLQQYGSPAYFQFLAMCVRFFEGEPSLINAQNIETVISLTRLPDFFQASNAVALTDSLMNVGLLKLPSSKQALFNFIVDIWKSPLISLSDKGQYLGIFLERQLRWRILNDKNTQSLLQSLTTFLFFNLSSANNTRGVLSLATDFLNRFRRRAGVVSSDIFIFEPFITTTTLAEVSPFIYETDCDAVQILAAKALGQTPKEFLELMSDRDGYRSKLQEKCASQFVRISAKINAMHASNAPAYRILRSIHRDLQDLTQEREPTQRPCREFLLHLLSLLDNAVPTVQQPMPAQKDINALLAWAHFVPKILGSRWEFLGKKLASYGFGMAVIGGLGIALLPSGAPLLMAAAWTLAIIGGAVFLGGAIKYPRYALSFHRNVINYKLQAAIHERAIGNLESTAPQSRT